MNKKKTSIILTLLVFAVILFSCEKEKAVFFPPELGELKITEITDSSICAKCSVLKNNELQLQEIGFCICNKDDSSIVRYVKCENQETFCATISGLSPQTNYSIKAYAKNVAGTTYSEAIISMTYSGYINEHPYIDLGLPSGTYIMGCVQHWSIQSGRFWQLLCMGRNNNKGKL
ncbi:MAG: fibronectin type III domain-containing protein [Bacteroidales bacterium]|nr:fibronectin type III domain-containing protein [Bacteroidales bacterium]